MFSFENANILLRLYDNDENDESFSMKTQTFERSQSKDNVLLFLIGISLQGSLIVNWQLNVYATPSTLAQ